MLITTCSSIILFIIEYKQFIFQGVSMYRMRHPYKHVQVLFSVTVLFVFTLAGCSDGTSEEPINTKSLSHHISEFPHLNKDILIACAASNADPNGLDRISVFFYPFEEAADFQYFESEGINIDPMDYSKYNRVDNVFFPVFNGYLQRYYYDSDNIEKWIILTYRTPDKIHICDPILLKHTSKPTHVDHNIVEIDHTAPTQPKFSWNADEDDETVIYFQVVSDSLGNLISGTYTYEKSWKFYDLSNVVLNIAETDPPPVLSQGSKYRFTLMAVSEDNWVNLIAEKEFITQ